MATLLGRIVGYIEGRGQEELDGGYMKWPNTSRVSFRDVKGQLGDIIGIRETVSCRWAGCQNNGFFVLLDGQAENNIQI